MNDFSKEHTQIAKGLAMILMLFDHLFWMDNGKYISIFPTLPDGTTIEWAIGSIGNICVAMFLVLSGYGMYCVVEKKQNYTLRDSLIRIKNLWTNYALITIVFIVLDLTFGKIAFDPIRIILNIFVLDFSYNKYAWFMITYIVIMLVFPLCYYLFKNTKWQQQIILIIIVKAGITFINMVLNHFVNVPDVIYKTFIEPFMFLPVFLIGYMCAEYDIYEKIYKKVIQGRVEKTKLFALLVAIFIFIYKFQYTVLDNVTAPIICFLIAYFGNGNLVGKGLSYIGKHSTNMWLIHYSIMVLLLNEVVYYPRVSIFVLGILIVLLLPLCYLFEYINNVVKNKGYIKR